MQNANQPQLESPMIAAALAAYTAAKQAGDSDDTAKIHARGAAAQFPGARAQAITQAGNAAQLRYNRAQASTK